jgi:hypothetical protein
MQAFPADSANNALGGGPLNKKIDHSQFMGTKGEEAFTDYSRSGKGRHPYDTSRDRSHAFNPTSRVDPVHGDETLGLGTSTFLEGAPASRNAIERRDSESAIDNAGGGLQRKKSLAQKIRGISSQNRQNSYPARVTSPEPKPDASASPPIGTALSTGGVKKSNERNPPSEDYDAAFDKKGESIAIAEQKTRTRAPSSPRRFSGPERKMTNDAGPIIEEPKSAGGFLSRVKSLKSGPKRARPSEKTTTQLGG